MAGDYAPVVKARRGKGPRTRRQLIAVRWCRVCGRAAHSGEACRMLPPTRKA